MDLRPGQPVVLLLPAGARAARVSASGATTVELVLLASGEQRLAPGQPVAIEATAPTGLTRCEGHVVNDDGQGAVRVRPAGQTAVVQRRNHVRVAATLDVEVSPVHLTGVSVRTLTRDVSAGGALLAGPPALHAGDAAWLRIELDDGRPALEAMAECVREEQRGARAVRFAVIDDADRERVVRFVFAQQRHARRMAREG